jgi:hypothetical protein
MAKEELSRGVGKVPIVAEMLDASPAGERACLNVGKHLETFKEEFASIGIQLGARYDGSPIIVSDGSTSPPDDPSTYRLPVREGERRIYFFPTTARFSIIWERGSPSFIFMESITPALWQMLPKPEEFLSRHTGSKYRRAGNCTRAT